MCRRYKSGRVAQVQIISRLHSPLISKTVRYAININVYRQYEYNLIRFTKSNSTSTLTQLPCHPSIRNEMDM
jgi:hypothetical protein